LGGRVALAPPKLGDWGLVGREEDLAALHHHLARYGSAAVVPVAGLGGLGKTALALGYLAVYGNRYDLIAWLDAERPNLIAGQYRSLVHNRTGVDVPEAEATAAALTLLAGCDNWLVIFDNATSPKDLHPYLPSGSGRVLVTTRNETWTANRDLKFRLDKLSHSTVTGWLNDAVPGSNQATLDELAGRLDGLPLAVVQALAYIAARPGETAAGYLAKLKTKAGQKQVLTAGRPVGYTMAVATTWDVAVDALKTEAPSALPLLRCLAYVNADNIPLAILDGLAGDDPASEPVAALARYGMVRFDAGQVSVHRLVQDVIRWPMSAEEEVAQVTGWAAQLDRLCPEPAEDHHNFAWYTAAALHLLALIDHSEELHLASPSLAAAANQAGISLIEQASHTTARALLERALAIKEAVYGPDHPSVAVTLTNLGNAYQELGDRPRAIQLYERALAIDEAGYGPDHPNVAVTLINLGNAYQALGDNRKAVELLKRALAIDEAVYGPDDPQVAGPLTNLGNAYQKLGDRPRAIQLYERALTIFEAVYGPDHPKVAVTLGNLGAAYQELGDNRKAVELYERALAIKKAVYGPDHPSVAVTLTNLGNAYQELGDRPRAIQLHERALTIFKAAYGPDHPSVAVTLTNLRIARRLEDDGSTTRRRRRRSR
jgi:tetratricopeptide (TPR) repeat protein